MPTTKTVTLYTYDELSDEAKEKAREWYNRASEGDNFFAEWVEEDATRMGALMGIEVDRIYWSGFWSQGSGACFKGSYSYKKGGAKAIKAETNDAELLRIATELQNVQRRAFYGLTAGMRQSGHYMHSGCMRVEVEKLDSNDNAISFTSSEEDDITQAMRDFADWIYWKLELAYEDSVSEEVVAENIRCNEYTFTEDGKRED